MSQGLSSRAWDTQLRFGAKEIGSKAVLKITELGPKREFRKARIGRIPPGRCVSMMWPCLGQKGTGLKATAHTLRVTIGETMFTQCVIP